MHLRPVPIAAAVLAAVAGTVVAQAPARAATVPAAADAFGTEPGGYLLAIPGVADDFVLFADGQWQLRADGTARLTSYVHSLSAVDRDFFLELTFDGRVAPGDASYPPAGTPVATLAPGAYAPGGTVDPSSWHYYTQVTGTLTGLRAYAGARVDLTAQSPAQVGDGANNKNVLSGISCDLALNIVQAPTSASFVPTGPAQLRGTFMPHLDVCATHVDDEPLVAGTSGRTALVLPGVADDYIWMPSGTWLEAADGTATLTGVVQRQSDYGDAWQLSLACDARVDPGDAAHPPAGAPDLQLLPTIYATQGGPIDPAHWRYYTIAAGTLVGLGDNDGGLVQLTATGALQTGLGAAQGNLFFGIGGRLACVVQQQPTSRTLSITGDATLRANLGDTCILPAPLVITGVQQQVDNVTYDVLTYTGTDLGFVAQVALGAAILGDDERNWFDGHFRIVDHETVELYVPQAWPAGTYPLTMLNATRISNPLSLTLNEPTTRTLRTENERLVGEAQHFVVHQGDVQGFAFNFLILSFSNLPSFAPGFVNLDIGNQFTDYVILDVVLQDVFLHTSVITIFVPPNLQGFRLYAQSALMDQSFFPMFESDVGFCDYL